MFYNERKEKRAEKKILCLAATGSIHNEKHTMVMGNSSRPSVKVNESLAQAAGSFIWSLGLVQRIIFQSLPWSIKEEKEIRISGELIYWVFLFLFLLLESPGRETAVLSVSLAVAPLLNIMEIYYYLSWCSVLAGMELTFVATCIVLCFGLVTKTVLFTCQCFSCGYTVLAESRLSFFSLYLYPCREQAECRQEFGRVHSWGQLTQIHWRDIQLDMSLYLATKAWLVGVGAYVMSKVTIAQRLAEHYSACGRVEKDYISIICGVFSFSFTYY